MRVRGFQFIQWCWAHLRRDFIALSDTDPSINNIGQELVDLTDEMFYYWHLLRGGTLTRGGLQESIGDLRVRVKDALARGTSSEHPLIAGRCRYILTRPEALWAFVSTEGVAPTNNAAERAIRPLVILRRLNYGTQSPQQRTRTFTPPRHVNGYMSSEGAINQRPQRAIFLAQALPCRSAF